LQKHLGFLSSKAKQKKVIWRLQPKLLILFFLIHKIRVVNRIYHVPVLECDWLSRDTK
jgi:hypothetical protein